MSSLRHRPNIGRLISISAVTAFTALATVMPSGLVSNAAAAPGVPDVQPKVHQSCAASVVGNARCFSVWRSLAAQPQLAVAPPTAALGPKEIQAAYQLDATRGAGQTIAIVDAYDNPKAEADLAVFRQAYGLPACTTANGCFRKVNQSGGSTPPTGNAGWGVEIALDIQAVSAACPKCKILLVEASSPSFAALGASVNTAVRLGAKVVSNSYGGTESAGSSAIGAKFYTHAGVAQVISSGDSGFQSTPSFPASLSQSIAVGGTTLTKTGTTWSEQAWSGSGSGCSKTFTKPSWQLDTGCQKRAIADVSAVGDPDTGMAVYDTYGGPTGWMVVGGTSLSAPLIAGMIGLAGNASALANAQYIYAHKAGLADVVRGTNGTCPNYLCRAGVGYDGPTGLGSPRGLSAL